MRIAASPAASRTVESAQFENTYLTEMCSGSEAGSYLRLIDFVYHSTLGLRVIKKKRSPGSRGDCAQGQAGCGVTVQELRSQSMSLK